VVIHQREDAVVIVALEEFIWLTHLVKKPQSLGKFFAESPLVGSAIDLEKTPH
jgi:hypothetical protein